MNLTQYLERRREQLARAPRYRVYCDHCQQPDFSCYCQWLRPVNTRVQFVILIHPIEMHRRIATGRMAHLCLKNSVLIPGSDFTDSDQVNDLIHERDRECMVLYPGPRSMNLTTMNWAEREALASPKLRIFVIDGTWNTAQKTMHVSQNLKKLDRIGFTPPGPSNFRIRQQPRGDCYSTIEAVHHTLALLSDGFGEHDHLIDVFTRMVDRQIELAHSSAHYGPREIVG